jgi:hypothetical protein
VARTVRVEPYLSTQPPPGGLGGLISTGLGFLTNPFLSATQALLGGKGADTYWIAGVEVNLDTGKVDVIYAPTRLPQKGLPLSQQLANDAQFRDTYSSQLTNALRTGTTVDLKDRRISAAAAIVNDLVRGGQSEAYLPQPSEPEPPPLEVPEPEPEEDVPLVLSGSSPKNPPLSDPFYGFTNEGAQSLPQDPFYAPQYRGGGVPVMVPIPPGGYAGFAQQTPAAQRAMRLVGAGGGTRRRRKKKKKAAPKRRARRAKGSKLKKGSAAAKAYMAKIRRMRKK